MIKLSTWLKIGCTVLSAHTFAADFGADAGVAAASNPPSEARDLMDQKVRTLSDRPIIRDGLRENRRETNSPDRDLRPSH